MPQKKNPDVAELTRGKTGRLYGNLTAVMVAVKGLPLTYNRDLQEDKEPLFDSIDTIKLALDVNAEMMAAMTVNTARLWKRLPIPAAGLRTWRTTWFAAAFPSGRLTNWSEKPSP